MASIINLLVEAVLEGLQCNGKKRLLQGSFLVLVSGNVRKSCCWYHHTLQTVRFKQRGGKTPTAYSLTFTKLSCDRVVVKWPHKQLGVVLHLEKLFSARLGFHSSQPLKGTGIPVTWGVPTLPFAICQPQPTWRKHLSYRLALSLSDILLTLDPSVLILPS